MVQKTVLITGCSEGTIGNALALEFAHKGWRVYATARKTTSMANLSTLSNVSLLAFDISERASVIAARDQISKDNNGKLDVLYHNAGYRALAMAIDTRDGIGGGDEAPYIDAEDARQFETNVLAVMAATRILAPLVVAARGTIAFTGSLSSVTPTPSSSAYNATKAALDQYSQCLRVEVRPLGVRVVNVLTGVVRSNMSAQRIDLPKGSLYEPIAGAMGAAWDNMEKDCMPADKYARYVVKKVASANSPKTVWAGGNSTLVWVITTFNLGWLVDMMWHRRFGFNKLVV